MARRTRTELDQAGKERLEQERRDAIVAEERRKVAEEQRAAEREKRRAFDARWAELSEKIEELWETTDTGGYGEEQIKEKIEQITGASVHDDHTACVEALEGNYYVVSVESKDPLGEFLTTADIDFDDDDACKAVARGCCENRSTFETLALWLELYGFELSRKRAA